jgi:hypothetical protein
MNRLLAFGLLFALSLPAHGWSLEGHRLVGEMAERQLSPAAKEEVARLLAGEAEPTLAGVSGWADEIRAASRRGPHGLGEQSTPWHYVNFPRGSDCAYVPARDCPDGKCVIAAIPAQRAILADRGRPLAERRDALKFLVHFVADAHQPMHAGFGDDRGGNRFQVSYRGRGARDPDGDGTNLHSLWDYRLLRSAGLSLDGYAERLMADPLPVDPTADAEHPPREWTLESCRLIRDRQLYPRSRRVGDDYVERHRPLAEARIRMAAVRLAALLERALAEAAGR